MLERQPSRDVLTSIGFGDCEAVEVGLSLEETRQLIQGALTRRVFVELEDLDGESLVINPGQVKLIQRSHLIAAAGIA